GRGSSWGYLPKRIPANPAALNLRTILKTLLLCNTMGSKRSGRGASRVDLRWQERSPIERLIQTGMVAPNSFISLRLVRSQRIGPIWGWETMNSGLWRMRSCAIPRAPVVPGGGGARKIRRPSPISGKGKSGGYRVLYAFLPAHGTVLLLAAWSKSE